MSARPTNRPQVDVRALAVRDEHPQPAQLFVELQQGVADADANRGQPTLDGLIKRREVVLVRLAHVQLNVLAARG